MSDYQPLTRKQQEIYQFLVEHYQHRNTPPTLDEICSALGLKSRGSLHKHIQHLVDAKLVEPSNRKQRGIRLTTTKNTPIIKDSTNNAIPYLGKIAAGQPLEAVANYSKITIPTQLKTENECYVLQVTGDSMIDLGIFNNDWVIIEKRNYAKNGDIIVALVNNNEVTLKIIEQTPSKTILKPANKEMQPMHFDPDNVQIQGILVGQMRSYIH
ncbi:MAG TPA: transcriptional repressor LexA [Methylococcaceae bacterium]|jgi:repressor LexA|nr:transcriptional repressor LexA [Methylococcaceae bacterium]HIN68171.1 transcriptional repressor LexA [Methylococcales bacterium]HIA45914.1 transcriptional repressor LexA [Methylococcaceae bacterium]HIB63430.1 transcriptional repressor LexA [Methylococcaceae bacterium]HIO12519.1 transcriptional repressor LexA [Methylococcales bacterium]